MSTIERDSVEDCTLADDPEACSVDTHTDLKEMDNFSTLHEQIQSCDSILEVMENLLRGFQV